MFFGGVRDLNVWGLDVKGLKVKGLGEQNPPTRLTPGLSYTHC